MSTGFSCNLGFPIPSNWAFDQFCEITSFASAPSFPLDKDAYSGRDTGISAFDKVEEKTPEEIEKENQEAVIEIARNQFIYDVLKPLGYLDKILNIGSKPSAEAYNIEIGIDNSGSLTLGCQNQITEITTELDLNGINEADTFEEILNNIALSVKSGNITFEIDKVTSYYAEFAITVSTENLMPDDSKLEVGISVTLHFKISLNGNGDKQFNTEAVTALAVVGVAAVVLTVAMFFLLPEGAFASIFAALAKIGGFILSAS